MPELPDVETYRRFLHRHAAGRLIRRVVVTDPGILRGVSPHDLDAALRNQRFEEPVRHGKWLIAPTTGPTVLFHFGMTGDLSWADDPEGRHRHDRVILELEGGELRYRNMRKLGGLWMAHDEEDVRLATGELGPDALDLDLRRFRALLSGRRGSIKALLMNQRILAGVGNLIADEALWQARIHPARGIDRLTADDVRRLHGKLLHVLRTSIERFDYVPAMRRWLTHVRGRPGAACPRCGTPLDRSVVAGRTTYWCPKCQPLD